MPQETVWRRFEPVGMAQRRGKDAGPKAVDRPKQRQSDGARGGKDRQRRSWPHVSDPEHERPAPATAGSRARIARRHRSRWTAPSAGCAASSTAPLRAERTACAPPRWLVKIRPKRAPCADDRRTDLRWPAHHHRRKAVQPQRDVAADVAVQPPRHVPQRSPQQQAGQQKWQTNGVSGNCSGR